MTPTPTHRKCSCCKQYHLVRVNGVDVCPVCDRVDLWTRAA